jgi:hypothetical protein
MDAPSATSGQHPLAQSTPLIFLNLLEVFRFANSPAGPGQTGR